MRMAYLPRTISESHEFVTLHLLGIDRAIFTFGRAATHRVALREKDRGSATRSTLGRSEAGIVFWQSLSSQYIVTPPFQFRS